MRLVARALLASVLALGGCALIRDEPAAPTPAPTPSAVTAFGGLDRAWLEITIAMDEELIPMLDLVPKHSGSSELQALALQVKGFTIGELVELHRLRDAAGIPRENKHKDMPMPGLVTADQVKKADKLGGPEFDSAALAAIKEFLDQSEQLAASEDKSGVEPQTQALAAQILRTRKQAKTTLESVS